MKNSTILVVGTLALVGAGAYVYLKGKKTPTVADNSLGLTPTKDDTKLLVDLGVKTEEPKATPYVKPVEGVPLLTAENLQKALLALNIDQTRSITELSSPNYIEAKRIASNMKEIDNIQKKKIGLVSLGGGSGGSWYWKTDRIDELSGIDVKSPTTTGGARLTPSFADILSMMTKKVNALGYKVLPNFDIEKM